MTTVKDIIYSSGRHWTHDDLKRLEAMRKEREASEMTHDLYKTGDVDAPAVIKDENGEVVLGLCRRCNKGEIELSEPCIVVPTVEELQQQLKEEKQAFDALWEEKEQMRKRVQELFEEQDKDDNIQWKEKARELQRQLDNATRHAELCERESRKYNTESKNWKKGYRVLFEETIRKCAIACEVTPRMLMSKVAATTILPDEET